MFRLFSEQSGDLKQLLNQSRRVSVTEQRESVILIVVSEPVFCFISLSKPPLLPPHSMASSSKATLILLIYGILMHYSVFCTPLGLDTYRSYPNLR